MTYLVVEQDGSLKRIILNRPEKRNAPSFCARFDFGNFPDCSNADLLLQFVRTEQMLQAVAYASIDILAFIHDSTIGASADLAIKSR